VSGAGAVGDPHDDLFGLRFINDAAETAVVEVDVMSGAHVVEGLGRVVGSVWRQSR
jgi:hypothetical protein